MCVKVSFMRFVSNLLKNDVSASNGFLFGKVTAVSYALEKTFDECVQVIRR
jgi:hypothetical protein